MKTFLLAEESKSSHVRQALLRKFTTINGTSFDQQLTKTKANSLWVTEDFSIFQRAFRSAAETIYKRQIDLRKRVKILLIAEETPATLQNALESIFKEVIVISHESALPFEELLEVISSKDASNYVIGCQADQTTGSLTLIRGDLSKLAVPFSAFRQSGTGTSPDFTKISVDDFGQTIRFGEYEASVDAVFYEFDPIYRRKNKKDLAKKDRNLGACLRRLRILKGFNQTDFPGVNEKEIGRIERGEVKPRKTTLEKIAKVLDVKPDKIVTY